MGRGKGGRRERRGAGEGPAQQRLRGQGWGRGEVGLGNYPQRPAPASVVLKGMSDASGLGLALDTWGTNTLKAGIREWTQEASPKPVSRGSLESQAVLSDGRTHSLDHRSLHVLEFPGRKRRDVALPSGNLMLEQRRQRPRKGQGMTRSVCGVTSGQSGDRGPGGCACESRGQWGRGGAQGGQIQEQGLGGTNTPGWLEVGDLQG